MFELAEELGTYCWDPTAVELPTGPKSMDRVKAEDVLRGLRDSEAEPSRLVDLSSLRLPVKFFAEGSLPRHRFYTNFPYSMGSIVPLVVALRRGVDVSRVDFVIGGSVLNVLASRKTRGKAQRYAVQRCPGTGVLVLGKSSAFAQDLGTPSFQFERLVTGCPMDALHDLRCFESLSLFRVAELNVLVSASVNALDAQGCAVQITTANPRHFGMRQALQMVSSGARELVYAVKDQDTVKAVRVKAREDLLRGRSPAARARAERNIVETFRQLRDAEALKAHDPLDVGFEGDGTVLTPSASVGLLPPASVVEELLEARRARPKAAQLY